MANTRSSWTGTLVLDLLAIPISLAKSTRDEREESIVTLCKCCEEKIDRSERCRKTGKSGPDLEKIKGVDLGDGTYTPIGESVWSHIEETGKDDRLEIMDAQPLSDIGLISFGKGTYYVRAKKDDRAAAHSLGHLTLALGQLGYGLVTKWKKSAKEDLMVLHAERGYLLATIIPYTSQLNHPGKQDRAHFLKAEQIDKTKISKLAELIELMRNKDGFQYTSYADEGLKRRIQAVDNVLAGRELEQQEKKVPQVPDLDAIFASIETRKTAV